MYHILSPAVFTDARGLSLGATGFFLLVGVMLWGLGWRWHKFWVVFSVTVVAGLLGLSFGRAAGVQVLVVAILLAIAAGMLALEIAKLLAFFTGGLAAWLGVQALMPQAQELWAAFLCGGLVGVLLYQLWTMLATSFLGTILSCHATVLLLDTFKVVKAEEFAEKYAAALNGWIVASTILGVLVQARTARSEVKDADKPAEVKKDEPQQAVEAKTLPMRHAA